MSAAPVMYRKRLTLTKGAAVTVSYAPANKQRIVVHGYDFRVREVVYAILGLLVALVIGVGYFDL